jgi:hypothetical protein
MPSELTLVILAAGVGRRFGSLKQAQAIGPGGEWLIDYSIHDARKAGFSRVVFVIQPDMEEQFRAGIGRRLSCLMDVRYAHQRVEDLPETVRPAAGREKPWGTGHALLAAEPHVSGPFAMINADDWYGPGSYAALASHLLHHKADHAEAFALIGFRLRDTLPTEGAVSRAICRTDSDGRLARIEECTEIRRAGDDASCRADGAVEPVSGDALVSMNCWGFSPAVFALLRRQFGTFLSDHGDSLDAEFQLPTAVNEMIQAGLADVRVLPARDAWFGMTHRADLDGVSKRIAELVTAGVYPARLWDA